MVFMLPEKQLTDAEEEVMQALWAIEKGVVRDILDRMAEPKPAYNTVSTVVRVLEAKGYIDHKAYGKTHEYFPLISKEEYSRFLTKDLVSNYFGGSFKKMLSFFVEEKNIRMKDLDDLLNDLETRKKAKK
jgi:BlaI family penicillinase repressor